MLKNNTTTLNDALSYGRPDLTNTYNGRVSLLFKCIRGIDSNTLNTYMKLSSNENITDTFILSFFIRNCRGGKGERKIGREMFVWLFNNHPNLFEKIFHLIPHYGRWDDLFSFFPNVIQTEQTEHIELQTKIVDFICKQLERDLVDMNNGKPISLCSKWCISENSSLDKKYGIVNTIITHMNISKQVYRKIYIVPLREYLQLVEVFMCSGRWSNINFNKVPSNAMNNLKNAFIRHTSESFYRWKLLLSTGKTKVNAKQLFPHEVIRKIRQNKCDEVCLAQWKVLEDSIKSNKKLSKTIVVVDTSGSMNTPNFLPLDIACSLGLLISNLVAGDFHNNIITFHTTPEMYVLPNTTIKNKYNLLKHLPWGGSTNIEGTFRLILDKAVHFNLKNEDLPEQVIIISDMQFDRCTEDKTNFEMIDNMYTSNNYTRPKLVFWNVNGVLTDFPVTMGEHNTCLISGSSSSMINLLLETGEVNTLSLLNNILNHKDYTKLKNLLNNVVA